MHLRFALPLRVRKLCELSVVLNPNRRGTRMSNAGALSVARLRYSVKLNPG
jgi:hypothetical protein